MYLTRHESDRGADEPDEEHLLDGSKNAPPDKEGGERGGEENL